ncbi:conserved hypothetical protein [Microsporum canis CBS 113480]|uniref:Uncharacterized protein n=1 Tax=Arthroderma otae (strain ATCC MYA-4605 / CBS 113480) TaxID=554155 RepID=C5FJI4_ARTOC|nr:conserved hypothetical protein [Microsporum canis CBS 113480]EEQ30845.1 conserved hypothetical protein [Microsporum canis CBS 113480]
MADSLPHSRIVPIMSPRRSTSQPASKGSAEQTGEAKMIFGHQGRQKEIRDRLVEHIRTNATYFVQFVSDVGGERRAPKRAAAAQAKLLSSNGRVATSEGQWAKFEKLLSKMKKTGFWGGSRQASLLHQPLPLRGPRHQPVHIAYHNFRHYSSVRSVDGPHNGVPELSRPSGCQLGSQGLSSEGRQDDGDGASSTDDSTTAAREENWPTTIAEAFPDIDEDTLRCALRRYLANLERVDLDKGSPILEIDDETFKAILPAFEADFIRSMKNLQGLHGVSSSRPSSLVASNSPPVPASAYASAPVSTPVPRPEPEVEPAALGSSPTKPRRRLIRGARPTPRTLLGSSSRSSSRNSTASKRSAGHSDDDDDSDGNRPLVRRQRGRDRKRRILQDVTLGLSDRDDNENNDIISVRPRVDPEAVAEQAEGSLDDERAADHEQIVDGSVSSATIEETTSSNDEASTAGESDSEFEEDC